MYIMVNHARRSRHDHTRMYVDIRITHGEFHTYESRTLHTESRGQATLLIEQQVMANKHS